MTSYLSKFARIGFYFMLSLLTVSASMMKPEPVNALQRVDFHIAVFGDSNSAGYAGIQPWVSKLQARLAANTTHKLNFIVTNYSVGGTTMAYKAGVQRYADTPQFQGFLNDPAKKADLAIIALGSNDALNQIPGSAYQTGYKDFLGKLHNSRKVGNVIALSVPRMTPPYNCIGSTCPVYNSTYNPNVTWIQYYNSYLLNNVATVCNNLNVVTPVTKAPMRCSYFDITSKIPATSSYVLWDGIHLLDNAQKIISDNMYVSVTAYNGRYVLNLPTTNYSVIDSKNGADVRYGINSSYGRFSTLTLKVAGQPLVESAIDLRTNLDWLYVRGNVNLTAGRSFITGFNAAPGRNGKYKLYIPRLSGHNRVRICPNVTAMAYVTATCANGYFLDMNTTQLNIYNDPISGKVFWTVSALPHNAGGLSVL